MITHVFICNKCDGDLEERIFEVDYPDYRTAEISPIPKCPKCSMNKFVTRFFGHNVFGPPKKSNQEVPDRYVPINPMHRKGILSVGMRIETEELEEAKKVVQKLVEVTSMEVIETENPVAETQDPEAPEKDILEEKLDLKRGTLDRAIFDIRQKNMLSELEDGKRISGFFMPLSGDSSN